MASFVSCVARNWKTTIPTTGCITRSEVMQVSKKKRVHFRTQLKLRIDYELIRRKLIVFGTISAKKNELWKVRVISYLNENNSKCMFETVTSNSRKICFTVKL